MLNHVFITGCLGELTIRSDSLKSLYLEASGVNVERHYLLECPRLSHLTIARSHGGNVDEVCILCLFFLFATCETDSPWLIHQVERILSMLPGLVKADILNLREPGLQ